MIYFLIDCSLYHLHSEAGKKSLKVQISQSLSLIRKYIKRDNLIIIGKNFDISFLGKSNVILYDNINKIDFSKFNPVILDPYAEKELKDDELRRFNLYILGGIVDVGQNWKYATSYLFRDLKLEKRKIVLRGSIIGVPDRINLIIKIILDSIFNNLTIEESIIKNQSVIDKIKRLNYDVKNGISVEKSLKYLKLDIKYVFKYKEAMNKKIKEYLELYYKNG